MTYRVGVDAGGTFTDLLVVDEAGNRLVHKVSSTPEEPALALVNGLLESAALLGLPAEAFIGQLELIVHGTTVATNALLTRSGAAVGLLCTEGFRDVLAMRDGTREEPYNNRLPVPVPLVPRHLRLGVPGRIDYTGHELTALDIDAARRAIEELDDAGVEAVAVCLLHSHVRDDHERAVATLIGELMPDAYVSVSSAINPQVGYFDRLSTAVLNAYVAPIVTRYMTSLRTRLRDIGFDGVLLLMQSNGGVASPEQFAQRAALSLLSGPASGPTAGLAAIRPLGREDCITIDMGGTSFDAAIVRGGVPLVMNEGWIDRWRLALPMLDIHTVGAGGGSIASVASGLLRVGPRSAGADPGPACYGRGGTWATVTDADLVLGYLDPARFLGGRLGLDRDAAAEAIGRTVAEPLGLGVVEAGAGIYDLVNVSMAEGVRAVTVNRGLDPRDFPLVVAGGAGPVHAAAIAAEIGIPLLVIPRESSVFCAGGMLLADFKHDFVRSKKVCLQEVDPAVICTLWREMRAEGVATLAAEGVGPGETVVVPSLDLHYRGQWSELTVDLEGSVVDSFDVAEAERRFHALHDLLFGYSTEDMPIDIVNARLSVRGTHAGVTSSPAVAGGVDRPLEVTSRLAWSSQARRMVPHAIYDGDTLGVGHELDGPAIIELATTTIVVPEGFSAIVDEQLSFVVHRSDVASDAIAALRGAMQPA